MRDRDLIYRLHKDWSVKTVRITKAGGQTNRNYIVEHKGKKFFVRLPWESDVIDRTIEGKNIRALSKNKKLASIVPKYHLYILKKKNILAKNKDVFDVPDGTIVAEYIQGREFTLRDFKKRTYQKALASMFYTFHISRVRFTNTYDVFRDEIEKYRVAAQKYSLGEITSEETISSFKDLEKQAKEKLLRMKKGISTHNDFIFQNFLVGKNNKVYLLDFEYAGFSKRGGMYYDFGFLFADNLFRKPVITKEAFEEFLSIADEVYGKKLNREQIYTAALAAIVMQFWWGILRYYAVQTKKEKQYFMKYVKERAGGIDKLVV